ncbi:MAG: hypothetical protein WC043_09750 [Pseudobdellovibrionaceae bacterium]
MSKNYRIIKATRDLQLKAGSGDILADHVRKAHIIMEANTIDFRDVSLEFLAKLKWALTTAKAELETTSDSVLINNLTQPIMELKANGQPFKFELVSVLANVMLGFLEHIHVLDKGVLEIIDAHCRTLETIIQKGIRGDGGQTGVLLKKELEEACNRYYAKNPQNFTAS